MLPKSRSLLLTAAIAVAVSSNLAFAQPAPNDDRCKAKTPDRQAENTQTAPKVHDDNGDKLADCGGVLKPPAVGDSELEKPAPKVGRTPVIKPGDAQSGQENNQQPGRN